MPKLFASKNLYNESLLKFPREGAEKAGVEGICWALEAMARRAGSNFILQNLGCPALVAHGPRTNSFPANARGRWAQQIAHGKYVEISGAGHALPLKLPSKRLTLCWICCNGRKILTPKKRHTQSSAGHVRANRARTLNFMSDELQEAVRTLGLEKFRGTFFFARSNGPAVLLEGMRPEVVGVFETAMKELNLVGANPKVYRTKANCLRVCTQGRLPWFILKAPGITPVRPKFGTASSRNI